MIRSMTAYASAETEIDGDLYGWEIRAVNHRYLDINLRIPEHLRKLESDFRASINRQLNRGKIDCVLNVRRQSGMQDDLHLDRQQLESLIRTVHEVESEMGNPAACSALEILAWPGILNERKGDPEVLKDPLGDLLMTAISTLIECREREGSQLAGLILDRCRLLTQQVEAVRLRLPSIAEKFRSRLQSRIADIAAEIDPVRFEQEISFLLQKMDVEEEMERLAAHTVEVERVIEHEDIAGRRLDFLFQEMNREANTLGSKSQDQETTKACVEMKVLIEQMREQVQNIE